jgi:acyl transferase domain-containing protein/acyl carrier protein
MGQDNDHSAKRSAEEIADWLVVHVAAELGLASTDLVSSQTFADHGLDSVHALRLTIALAEWLGRPATPELAYDYPTIDLLAQHLASDEVSESPAEPVVTTDRNHRGATDDVDEPIAIIGIGCRFPGAEGPSAYWRLLAGGQDAITEVSPNRWHPETFASMDPGTGDNGTRWGGFLPEIDQFDAGFFGISPREAVRMDPQQRLVMEVGWEALEDAGQVADRLAGSSTGVFIGISTNEYANVLYSQPALLDPYSGTGMALSITANRLSYFLDLRGPSVAVDTACSSSLVAVHMACRSLRDTECDLALAGGVNVMLSPALNIVFSKAGVMAPNGRCKVFDAHADGYVRGEGAGIVVLKPLSRALADSDTVYAIIRGSATNHDGRTNGLMTPNRRAQEALLVEAYGRSGVSPGAVQYVEAHGTGTYLGDTIEAKALGTVLAQGRSAESRCLIGSHKTNIGHLESAAGVAGLIKVALALHRRMIPPSLHYTVPNPDIPFESLPLQVADELTPWPHSARQIAGVSSFGFGGTNAHVVLAGAPQVRVEQLDQASTGDRTELLILSAKSSDALDTLADRYRLALAEETPLSDLCYTAAARRTHHDHRLAVLGTSHAQMSDALRDFRNGVRCPGLSVSRRLPAQTPEVVFVFSGQGSQWFGMGQRLYMDEVVFRDALDRCDHAIRTHRGDSILDDLFADRAWSRLDDIDVVQPAIFAVQVALASLWNSWGVKPDAVIGHSMGEVAAAHIAGALSLDDATKVICARGQLLRRASGRGAMLAAEITVTEAHRIIGRTNGDVAIAATNSHQTTVLSGDREALTEIMDELGRLDRFCRWVNVDVVGHSLHMQDRRGELRVALADIQPTPPKLPMYSSVSGALIGDAALDQDYWAANLSSPVNFSEGIRCLLERDHSTFIEVSPHPILLTSVGEDAEDLLRTCVLLPSMRRDRGGRDTLLGSLGGLYASGLPVAWDQVYARGGRCVPAPTYPWKRDRYWLGPNTHVLLHGAPSQQRDAAQGDEPHTTDSARETANRWPSPESHRPEVLDSCSEDVGHIFYELSWHPRAADPTDDQAQSRPHGTGVWLIFGEDTVASEMLRSELEDYVQTCVLVKASDKYEKVGPSEYRLDPAQREDYDRLLKDLRAQCLSIRGVAHLWGPSAPPLGTTDSSLPSSQTEALCSVLYLVQALTSDQLSKCPRLWLITRGVQVVHGVGSPVSFTQAPVWGLGRCINHEHPELACTRIDLPGAPQRLDIGLVAEELLNDGPDLDVALRDGRRYVARLQHCNGPARRRATLPVRAEAFGDGACASVSVAAAVDEAHIEFESAATYLITGGLGAIGLTVARWMAQQGARHLVLVGRSAGSEMAHDCIDTLQEAGTEVVVLRADVSRRDELKGVLDSIGDSMPPLRGVMHAAGILDGGMLVDLSRQRLQAVMAPKVDGAWNLHTLTSDMALDSFVLFSSAASVFGSPGQASYAAANAFLDGLAWHRRTQGLPATSVNWGPWAGAGIGSGGDQQHRLSHAGFTPMPPAYGMQALSQLLQSRRTQVIAALIDWGQVRGRMQRGGSG